MAMVGEWLLNGWFMVANIQQQPTITKGYYTNNNHHTGLLIATLSEQITIIPAEPLRVPSSQATNQDPLKVMP